MKVRRYDYPSQFGNDISQLVEEIREMLLQGHYVLSREVHDFEEAFAKYLDVRYALGVNSGTDALLIALQALGIGSGDEVITQANTFHATVAAICLCGATPVLVDADPLTFLMNQSQIESVVTSRTRAIIPVHLFGKPTTMDGIMSISHKHIFHVVEDAAQAHGARIHGKRVGTFGDFGCFSFHPSKNFAAAGDAGAIVTNNQSLADEVARRRALGQKSQNEHVSIGLNSKLDALQARVLHYKLPQLDAWNESRRAVAESYRERLADLPLILQQIDEGEDHVFHLFQVGSTRRDELLAYLRSQDVDATIRYPVPIHLQESFSNLGWRRGQFPVAERLSMQLLCLPIRPNMSMQEVEYVAHHVRRFFEDKM